MMVTASHTLLSLLSCARATGCRSKDVGFRSNRKRGGSTSYRVHLERLEERRLLAPVVDFGFYVVPENSPADTLVGTVVAVGNGTLGFTITDGNTSIDGDADPPFKIDSETGLIQVNDPGDLDFETRVNFILTATVTDDSGTGEGVVEIDVEDQNDAPVVPSQSFTIPENLGNATVVGTLDASDEDAGQTISYSLNPNEANDLDEDGRAPFRIDSESGLIQVHDSDDINFELRSSFDISVTVTDDNTDDEDEPDEASTTTTFTVNLLNLIENLAPEVDDQEFSIPVDAEAGDEVGTVEASDADEDQTLTYSIEGGMLGNEDGDDMNIDGDGEDPFEIDSKTGKIFVNDPDDLANGNEDILLTVRVTDDGEDNLFDEATITISVLDVDDPTAELVVSSVVPTSTGFVAEFNGTIDGDVLNLYDTQTAALGPADVTLVGVAGGPVGGSLVIDPSLRKVTFLKSGGPLDPDTYTVMLRSAADGFRSGVGVSLDGNGDGTAGDEFVGTFSVLAPPANAVVVGVLDFVRGPGQDVNLPADTAAGIPLSLSEGIGVRSVSLRIDYDPSLLSINTATIGSAMPAGATAALDTTVAGTAFLVFNSPTDLPSGSSTFVNLQATVPATDPSGIYGNQQVLNVHSVTVSDVNDKEFPAIADDALHLASYFGDVSGNGRINALDAAQAANVAALVDRGFAATPLADPRIMADISGNGRINAADASLVARFAALIDVPEIPPVPSAIAATGGPDAWQFGSVVLPDRPQDLRDEAANNLKERSTSVNGWENLSNHLSAVDSLMGDRRESSVSAAEEEPSVALEEAVDEILAGLGESVLASGW